jgi:hypothetical protein
MVEDGLTMRASSHDHPCAVCAQAAHFTRARPPPRARGARPTKTRTATCMRAEPAAAVGPLEEGEEAAGYFAPIPGCLWRRACLRWGCAARGTGLRRAATRRLRWCNVAIPLQAVYLVHGLQPYFQIYTAGCAARLLPSSPRVALAAHAGGTRGSSSGGAARIRARVCWAVSGLPLTCSTSWLVPVLAGFVALQHVC